MPDRNLDRNNPAFKAGLFLCRYFFYAHGGDKVESSKLKSDQFNDLLYTEAKGNYTAIVTASNTLIPVMTFSIFEELLPAPSFLRVHRFFIVNKSKITHIEGNSVYIGKN
jgi:hypothetical protein